MVFLKSLLLNSSLWNQKNGSSMAGILKSGSRNSLYCIGEFSSNPNQTQLSMLINVFRIIRKSQVGEFDQGWS